jgi:hypothetical protein
MAPKRRSDDAYAADDGERVNRLLAFLDDRAALARRFILSEVLAPPLALRRRGGVPGMPSGVAAARARRGR